MALLITPTPVLDEKEAIDFLNKVIKEQDIPVYGYIDKDKLEKVRLKIIEDFSLNC